MQKPADTNYPILDILKKRWSPRSFSDQALTPAQIKPLFEAARWAASSFNEQPWRFVIATKDDWTHYERILSCLVEKNQAWAKTAPLIGISIAKENFTKNDGENRCCEHDIGLAIGNLTAQATSMDLFVHEMAGIDQEKAKTTFNIPDGYHAFAGFAIGHVGKPEDLAEDWMVEAEKADRERKAFGEFIFGGAFGEVSPIFSDE